MDTHRDEPALDDEDAQALDTELHGGLADDATDAEVDAAHTATSAEDVDKERSGPS